MNAPHSGIGATGLILYIFIGSDRPDVYINSIGHCVGQRDNLRVILVHILDDRGKRAESAHLLGEVQSNIRQQLDALMHGQYIRRSGRTHSPHPVALQPFHVARYVQINGVPIETLTVPADELEKAMTHAAAQSAIFDASAAPKPHLIKLLKVLSQISGQGLFVLELLQRIEDREFDERELIHNLALNTDYAFRDLLDGFPRSGALEPIRKAYINDLSASILLLCATALLVPSSLLAFAAIAFDWNKVEWIAFIVFGLPTTQFMSFLLAAFGVSFQFEPNPVRRLATRWASSRLEHQLKSNR